MVEETYACGTRSQEYPWNCIDKVYRACTKAHRTAAGMARSFFFVRGAKRGIPQVAIFCRQDLDALGQNGGPVFRCPPLVLRWVF